MSERPGLGIELNEATIERYRLRDPRSIPEGHYSDMVFGKSAFNPAGPYVERT